MTLQYRPDTDRLLYIDEIAGDPLAAECCCATEAGTIVFYMCCDDVPFEDREDHPHFVTISSDRDTALGSPDMVVYGDCCYWRKGVSGFPANVPEADVTASATTTCDDCRASDGENCLYCPDVPCNSCNPELGGWYRLTFGALDDEEAYCDYSVFEGLLAEVAYMGGNEGSYDSYDCSWTAIITNTGDYPDHIESLSVQLTWGTRWRIGIEINLTFGSSCTRQSFWGPSTECDPKGSYEDAEVGGDVKVVVS